MIEKNKKAESEKVTKFQVKIEKDKCKGCGFCIAYCPVGHLLFSKGFNKKGRKFARVNKENKCIGCGVCFLVCPDAAVKIYEKE
ncbi:MAG: 4Fe-4S binding protein [Candidatus Omnitrophica bacterium]|nr:4Fe-4S binding protein [Candidatus Omnitrophota bacterium]